MLSSTSVQKFHGDKKPEKRYQKFKGDQEKDNTFEKSGYPLPVDTTKKSFGFADLKDFPQLRRQNKNPVFENKTNSNRSKNFKPGLFVVTSRNEKKLNEPFPALVKSVSRKKNEIRGDTERTYKIRGDGERACEIRGDTERTYKIRGDGERAHEIRGDAERAYKIREDGERPYEIRGDIERPYKNRGDSERAQEVPKNVALEPADAGGGEQQSGINNKEKPLKKSPGQPKKNPNKKKRSDPVFINFDDILLRNKIRKRGRRGHQKILRNKFQRYRDNEQLSGNILDSSNPKRNRGKHREIKKKKLSNLKTTIIKERIIKSKTREMAGGAKFGSDSVDILDKIDFHTEIKVYLNELNSKMLKKRKTKKSKISEDVNVKSNLGGETLETSGTKLDEKNENLENVPPVKEKILPHITADGGIKFSSKFREYCDNMVTPDLNSAVSRLIGELIKLQDRLFLNDPIKAKARKRHVSGMREVKKYLGLKKVKLIIIPPNLEKLQMEGSVYDSVNEMKSMCDSQNVPYAFALDRYRLGRCARKNVPVSAFAVLSYEGIEALYENVLHELKKAKETFSELMKPKSVEGKEDVNSKVLSALISAFEELLQVPKEAPPEVN